MLTLKKSLLLPLLAGALSAAPAFAQDEGSSGLKPAGLFVEPGVTYQTYKSNIDYPAPFENSSGEVKGFGVMARLGFHINESIFIAADGRYSMPTYKDSINNLDKSATEYDIGPSVGVQMPDIGLRVWGTYILTSQLDPKGSDNLDYKFTSGQGYRIGAGFRVSIVSLNLEYQNLKYGRTDIEKIVGLTGSDTSMVKYDGSGWIASVSFPLEL